MGVLCMDVLGEVCQPIDVVVYMWECSADTCVCIDVNGREMERMILHRLVWGGVKERERARDHLFMQRRRVWH